MLNQVATTTTTKSISRISSCKTGSHLTKLGFVVVYVFFSVMALPMKKIIV